jgi:transposase-like protein
MDAGLRERVNDQWRFLLHGCFSVMVMCMSPYELARNFLSLDFATETQCRNYLAARRGPDGAFVCPKFECKSARANPVRKNTWQCSVCGHQLSLTSGTMFHNTKTPLTTWFRATYLMIARGGISALDLQADLGVPYNTAWTMLAKLRQAMNCDTANKKLHEDIELTDTWVGKRNAAHVLVAVERRKRGAKSVRVNSVRMKVISDSGSSTEEIFLRLNIAKGDATFYTASKELFPAIEKCGLTRYRLESRGEESEVPLADRETSRLHEWLQSVYHNGVSRHRLQPYLDEFNFHTYREQYPGEACRKLIRLAVSPEYRKLYGPSIR